METTYYTLTAREIIVTGDAVANVAGAPARQLVCVRKPAGKETPGKNNVIDLAAWKADREEERRLEAEWYDGVDRRLEQPAEPVRRPRWEHRALLAGELLATLSVIGAMLLLMVRVLAA